MDRLTGRRASLSIESRFNGPLESANGGYCSGALSRFLPAGAAEVTLRRPVPLEATLEVVRDGHAEVRLFHGEALVAEARSVSEVGVEVPAPVDPEEARAASARYRGRTDGAFARCFVCGRARDDAFGVFAGSVGGRALVASPWTPPAWTADDDGNVLAEFVWAVLDCPTYFALYADGELPLSVLAQLTARVEAPVAAGREHVVIAWPIGYEGRKHRAGSAVLAPDGEPLAVARALLIEPRR